MRNILIGIISLFVAFLPREEVKVAQVQVEDKTDLMLRHLKEVSSAVIEMKTDMSQLEGRLSNTENDVIRIKSDMSTIYRNWRSGNGKLNDKIVPYRTDSKILIVNNWVDTINAVINGEKYSVIAGVSKTIRVASGKFSYRILEIPYSQWIERDIAPDETFKITIVSDYEVPSVYRFRSCR